MSNNYHTQLNQQNGMLNEIASTNQLMHQRSAPDFDVKQGQQHGDQNQKSWNNYGHMQGTPINNEKQVEHQNRNVSSRAPQIDSIKQDDIQFSDIERDTGKTVSGFSPAPLPRIQEPIVEKISRRHDSPKNKEKQIVEPFINSEKPKPTQPESQMKNYAIEYALIPIFIVIIFVLLVHPTTSTYLEKYIPKMVDLKGYAIRGIILAIMYIIIKIIISQTIKKN